MTYRNPTTVKHRITKNYCNRPLVCVEYIGNHSTTSCSQQSKIENVKCSNCHRKYLAVQSVNMHIRQIATSSFILHSAFKMLNNAAFKEEFCSITKSMATEELGHKLQGLDLSIYKGPRYKIDQQEGRIGEETESSHDSDKDDDNSDTKDEEKKQDARITR
ncbi:hypothetical protein HZH66_013994 [Vespula vulgaris]|uniref:Uncharacterized protein n=1 Tax=Vespula vulgaris TaxID=7454 RepID=A0A834MQP5_VESVU|nr:hypothetical protein HZH66_013994 [Vespula vulgaris]